MTDEPEILTRVDNGVGLLTLNRPKAINSLTQSMVDTHGRGARGLGSTTTAVRAVVLDGAGERGLCAGGDVVAIYHSARADGAEARKFWFDEYRLIAAIGSFPKPYVALMDGIVMGGGVGVGTHGNVRVVTDTTKMAMPEVGIGFIPDVGGTYPLSRAPGVLGLHAALTGAPFSGADAIALGFADHFVPHDELAAFSRDIVANDIDAALGRARGRAPAESASRATAIGSTSASRATPYADIVAATAGPRRRTRQRRRQPDREPLAHRGVGDAGGGAPRRQARHPRRRAAPGVSGVVRVRCAHTTSWRASAPSSSTRTATRSGRPRRWPRSPPPTSTPISPRPIPISTFYRTCTRATRPSSSTRDDRVGIITLNRPKALNALNSQVMDEVTAAAAEFDNDPGIGAIIITGNEKAFAAGADIKEMADLSFADVFAADFFAQWDKFAATRTPTIAAVAGYALGGGCELAMMCDC